MKSKGFKIANRQFYIRARKFDYVTGSGSQGLIMGDPVDQHLSFHGKDVMLYPKDNVTDLTPWEFTPVEGTEDQFYIRNRWKELEKEGRVGDHLSFTGNNIELYPKDNTNDLVPWKLVPVEGKDDEFHFQNMWKEGVDKRAGTFITLASQYVTKVEKKSAYPGLYKKRMPINVELGGKEGYTPNIYALRGPAPFKLIPARLKSSEVEDIIKRDLKGRLSGDVKIRLADAHYVAPPLSHAKNVIQKSSVDRLKWKKERFDCDDFALVLKSDFAMDASKELEFSAGYAFGILWGTWVKHGGHAINWMITDDLKLRLIEPQNDKIFFPDDSDGEDFNEIYFMIS